MNLLRKCAAVIDAFTVSVGKAASWLMIIAIVVSAGNAVVRKLFDSSSNAWLDLQWMLFGAVFLLCSAWTLRDNEHVRIDVLTSMLSRRKRTMIDAFGHLVFLMPFAVIVLIVAWPFVHTSILLNEQSANSGGLPVWPAKLLVLLGFSLLLLQGISEFAKCLARLLEGKDETTTDDEAPPAAGSTPKDAR